ncbi:MAG: zf-HC2 domain-containing protein [Bryobacteraceae bacterium]|jgi:anti-sigma factor RsiW
MHAVVTESLEQYLSGTLEPAAERAIEAHLDVCPRCRKETQSMQEVSRLFGALRTDEVWEPSPGFHRAVMRRLGERMAVPTFTSLFTLDFAFGRRLVFASLLTLAVLGSYLVARERGHSQGPLPEAVMAEQVSPAFDTAPAPDAMLVTLTAYVR